MNTILINAVFYGVILNIVISLVLSQFATPDEVKPPNGAQNLSFKGQIMHMFVHHGKVLFTSSIIIVIVVGLAVCLAEKYPLL